MSELRRLIVMRHAKAVPYAETDFVRDLTAKGRADAAAVGHHLKTIGIVPDHAVVSSAARTQQTWAEVKAASGASATSFVDQSLYAAQPDVIIESLRLVPPEVNTTIFVGHNPGAAYLSYLLDDGLGDPAVVRSLLEGFPTAAIAVFELPGSWEDLAMGQARITHFHVGHS